MKKAFLLSLILTALAINAQAQGSTNKKGHWSFGGNVGMSFGDNTVISIAPQAGYSFNKYLTLGGGVSYSHYDYKDYDYKRNYYGVNLFARAYPVSFITVFAQPELLRFESKDKLYDHKEKDTFGCLLIGGGLVTPLGFNGSMIVSVYYDVVQHKYSPYKGQLGYSVGYNFSF